MAPTPGHKSPPAHREKISSFLPPFIFSHDSTDFLRMNVVVAFHAFFKNVILHFDSLFSCFGIATARTSFVSITKTGSKTKVRTCLQEDEVMKGKVFIVSHRYCHGYSRSQFVAKYLNTSSIKINPHPLCSLVSAGGPARPFPSVYADPGLGGDSRAGRGRTEVRNIGCRSTTDQSESNPRQDKT